VLMVREIIAIAGIIAGASGRRGQLIGARAEASIFKSLTDPRHRSV
jgi:hypothetical protein